MEGGEGVFIFAVWTEAGQPTDIWQILSLAISIWMRVFIAERWCEDRQVNEVYKDSKKHYIIYYNSNMNVFQFYAYKNQDINILTVNSQQ